MNPQNLLIKRFNYFPSWRAVKTRKMAMRGVILASISGWVGTSSGMQSSCIHARHSLIWRRFAAIYVRRASLGEEPKTLSNMQDIGAKIYQFRASSFIFLWHLFCRHAKLLALEHRRS